MMWTDIRTVMWKELRSMARMQGNRGRIALTLGSPALVGCMMAWEEGAGWAGSFMTVLMSGVVTLLVVVTLIPDAFAGERERHTMETLLASRLSDRAIMVGKVLMALICAVALSLVFLGVGLATANVKASEIRPFFYQPDVLFANLGLILVFATLMSGSGILISLRSETAQGAQQMLTLVFFAPLILLQVPLFMFMGQLQEVLVRLNGATMLGVLLAVLAATDVVVWRAASSRFRRSRLII